MRIGYIGFDRNGTYVATYDVESTQTWQYVFAYDADECNIHHSSNTMTFYSSGPAQALHNPIGPARIVQTNSWRKTTPAHARIKSIEYYSNGRQYDPARIKFEYIPLELREVYIALGYSLTGNYRRIDIPDPLEVKPRYIDYLPEWSMKL